MGTSTYDDEKEKYCWSNLKDIPERWIGCLGSFLVSLVGGVMLSYWEFKYHPTNSQLWMVPFGLILFFTPVIVCFSIFVSEICNPVLNQADIIVSSHKQLSHSLSDLETCDQMILQSKSTTSL